MPHNNIGLLLYTQCYLVALCLHESSCFGSHDQSVFIIRIIVECIELFSSLSLYSVITLL